MSNQWPDNLLDARVYIRWVQFGLFASFRMCADVFLPRRWHLIWEITCEYVISGTAEYRKRTYHFLRRKFCTFIESLVLPCHRLIRSEYLMSHLLEHFIYLKRTCVENLFNTPLWTPKQFPHQFDGKRGKISRRTLNYLSLSQIQFSVTLLLFILSFCCCIIYVQ